MICVLFVDFIEENKKVDDKKDDEATPIDTKRCLKRLSSEKAKKRLK